MTCILVHFDMGRINDLSATVTVLCRMSFEKQTKDFSLSLSEIKTVDRIPPTIPFGHLILLAVRHHDPPNSIQYFSEIGWFPSSYANVGCCLVS